MGGFALAPQVWSLAFGKKGQNPELLVLDSTDPAQIRSMRARIDPARTLFCVSSKSGTIFLDYFFAETKNVLGERAGQQFIAVTDPGSELAALSETLGFRRLYHGDPTIAACYSALSDFGLVPQAAIGMDTGRFLKRAILMEEACKIPDSAKNPGVSLGLILGTAAKFGRDKVTLVCSKSFWDLGPWIEQLLAGSTGKESNGLIPIDREPLLGSGDYGKDRVFAYLKFTGDNENQLEGKVRALELAGQPVIRTVFDDLYDVGQSFFQWEIATVVAGSILGINVFDQAAEGSKYVNRELIPDFESEASLPTEKPMLEHDGIQLFADARKAEVLLKGGSTLGSALRQHLDRLEPGDYFGLLAFIPMFSEYEHVLLKIRQEIAEAKQVATVLGFGPRFLHSTGPVYKDGPNSGVFLQITCDDADDLQIPQRDYTFGFVKSAQARRDFRELLERRRRALRVHLTKDIGAGLRQLRDLICAAIAH
jgi:hypothetical protein